MSMSSTFLRIPKIFTLSASPPLSFNFSSKFWLPVKPSSLHKLSTKIDFSHGGNRVLEIFSLRASSPGTGEPLSNNQSSITVEQEEEEAQEAVSEILQEFGVSTENSIEIASNSPRYVKMLVDSVRELNELSLWSSWRRESDEEMEIPLCFKKKVYYMAKEKGDNGKVPFLESVGLSLSSAMNVARYLSSETLPVLIHKVKYVKEIFFSDSDDGGIVGKNARRMMMHLSVPVDEDVQQTLSFFEKIEARRGGLDMLGSKDAAFRYLVESFPRILLLSVKPRMKRMIDFLEVTGVPRERIRNVLILFPPIILYDIERDIKPKILAFEKAGAVDNDFGKMLLKYPWLISTSIQENYEEILSFFDLERVPKSSVDRAIKSWPHLLGCSPNKLKLMVDELGNLGVKNKKLGQVIASSPQLLLCKAQEFLQVVSFFEDLGFDREPIGRILGRCPEIFATSIEKTLERKLKFLASVGISKNYLPRVIRKYPELFVSDFERTLLPRMEYLIKKGLSKREIAFMIRKFSPLMGYSIDKVLRPKLEFLVETMEKPVEDVVEYPRYFSYSLEKKIKPRFWVLKRRNVECSLQEMLGKNDEEFAEEYMGIGRMLVPPSSYITE